MILIREIQVDTLSRHRTYYHAVAQEETAQFNIKHNAIIPPKGKITGGGGLGVEQKGSIYMTAKFSNCMPYLRGDYDKGAKVPKFGYVFMIKGSELTDVDPDEDEVAEYILTRNGWWLKNIAEKKLSPRDYDVLIHGSGMETSALSIKLMGFLLAGQRKRIIDATNNIANHGRVVPFAIYRASHKDIIGNLYPNATFMDFVKIATKIK